MYTYIYVYTYLCIYTHMYVYTNIYIHIYVTYIHMYNIHDYKSPPHPQRASEFSEPPPSRPQFALLSMHI